MRLSQRKIIVTGGASGIGLATAKTFLREGAAVAILDRDTEALAAAARDLANVVPLEVDVSLADDVAASVEVAAKKLGGLDGIVNGAGIATRAPFDETTLEMMRTDIAVNLLGPFNVIRAALSFLRHAGGGTIVNIASGVALRPLEHRTAYAASKGGLIAMSKAIALDLASDNIRVNVVCPGPIETSMVKKLSLSDDDMRRVLDRRLIRRQGNAQEVADAILFLTCQESSYVTASMLAVDGGGAMH